MTRGSTLTVKVFTIQGLNCPSCAAKIERAAGEISGVRTASLNLMKSTLTIEAEVPTGQSIHKIISQIVSKYEPGAMVSDKSPSIEIHEVKECSNHDHDHDHDHGHGNANLWLVRIVIGALALGVGLILEYVVQITVPEPLPNALFLAGYALLGYDILFRAAKNITRGNIFNENFLMSIATIGAIVLTEYAEAVGVMLFYQVGEFCQSLAVAKSKKSIADLMDIRPDYANIESNGQIVKVPPETVDIGATIIVKPGEKIPLDGIVSEGTSMLDTTALTGESVPRRASPGDNVLSGCVNQNGVLRVEVTKVYSESTVAKIIDLVENAAARKAPTEKFITKFARYYTPAVCALAVLIAVVPVLFFAGDFSDWFRRALIFLVISCPCALVLSIPLSFFGGIGGASRKGILIKGGNYLEALANVDMVVFDKTGTLTKGVFKVTGLFPSGNFSKAGLLEAAACAEAFSNHPIALSILGEYSGTVDKSRLSEYSEIAGLGTKVTANGRRIYAGNTKLMGNIGVSFTEPATIGTNVYVAVDGVFAGCITISDEIKQDSGDAIRTLKGQGVRKIAMLTGDNAFIAKKVADELGIDEFYAGLLPGQKVEKLEELNARKRAKGKLVFAGDGINDAPVLAMADVGVAMGGLGSDAAIEAADVVLMTDEPSKLAEAVNVARFTKRIVWQNIVLALGIKGLFMVLGAFGIADIWEAVFADVGVALIAVLNAAQVIRMR